MARKPRVHLPGGVYHVMLRGNGGQDIFFTDDDRYYLYQLLEEGINRFQYRIHGFCCMANHLHLAIQVSDIPLSKGMQNLAFRYTRWINRRENRIGHLFQGRYKAILVDVNSYLLELVRYIHLNPVRAGLVVNPRDYVWSGHRAYLGEDILGWLTQDWVLSQFAPAADKARSLYNAFIRQGVKERYRDDFHRGGKDPRVLGDDSFMERAMSEEAPSLARVPSLDMIVTSICEAYKLDETTLRTRGQQRLVSEARATISWLAVELRTATLTEVGRRFDRDVGTMSSAVRRLVNRAGKSKELAHRLSCLKSKVKGAVFG